MSGTWLVGDAAQDLERVATALERIADALEAKTEVRNEVKVDTSTEDKLGEMFDYLVKAMKTRGYGPK